LNRFRQSQSRFFLTLSDFPALADFLTMDSASAYLEPELHDALSRCIHL
jgi:hypothetical protein